MAGMYVVEQGYSSKLHCYLNFICSRYKPAHATSSYGANILPSYVHKIRD